ncbi:MAG TPA: tetratricopeptide repeat protein [Acidobacteriota bacterium]|nr:tetratricopeptide repeat protein [Acidobacteriota bacterium]
MTYLSDVLAMFAFRPGAIRDLAERRAMVAGGICFSIGYLLYGVVRSSVYASLPELVSEQSVWIGYSVLFQLFQVFLFLLVLYIPFVIVVSNAISGDGCGLSISRQEYQAHVSALLPLWGVLFLAAAPLQWLLPHFLVVGEVIEISIGIIIRSILVAAYTLWGIRQLNYLSGVQALGVFALSWFTFPAYYLLTSFLSLLPLFILIPLIYWGSQWFRGYHASHVGERDFQRHLRALTLNPQDADAQYQLGLIYLKRRNLDAARRYFESALKIDAADPDYHYYLGRAHELGGHWDRALEQYEETYRLNPEYGLGDIFREVGKGYLHTGNVEKGMEFLGFFLSKRGSDPEGRYWLAVALQKTGDRDQMRAQLTMIAEQARSNPRFFRKENREWIYRARQLIRDSRNS